MKYVTLEFKSAKCYFADYKKGYTKHNGEKYKAELYGIDSKTVSNVLHVLCGLPPVSRKRVTPFKENADLCRCSKDAWVKYDNKFVEEFVSSAKGVQSSNRQVNENNHWNYAFLEKNIGSERFAILYDEIKRVHGDKPLMEVMRSGVKLDRVVELPKDLDAIFYEGVTDCLNITNSSYKSRSPLLNTNGVGRVVSMYGEIVVIVDDYIADAISQGSCLCTILDGGLCRIKKIEGELELSEAEFDLFDKVDDVSGCVIDGCG